jgi:hypothetical protein
MPDDYVEPTMSTIHQDDAVDSIRGVQKMTAKEWENFQHFHPKIARNLKTFRNTRQSKSCLESFYC